MNKKTLSMGLVALSALTLCACSANIDYLFTSSEGESTTIETTTKGKETETIETTTKGNETKTSVEETTTEIPFTTLTREKKEYTYSSFIDEVFGEDTIIYNVSDSNPYGIDLSKYGKDISAIFYEPKDITNPYTYMSKDYFYKNYDIALTYEDAMNRSECGLISGDITPQNYLPSDLGVIEDDTYIRASSGTYILSMIGEYLGYIPNTFGS